MVGVLNDSLFDSVLEYFNIANLALMIQAPVWFRKLFPLPQTPDPQPNPIFLINIYGIFVFLAIILSISLFLNLSEKLCRIKRWRTLKKVVKNLLSLSLFIAFVLFANSVSTLPYFYILEFRNLILENFWEKLSFGVSIFLIFLYALFIWEIIYLVNNVPTHGYRYYVKKWKYFELLFSGFEEKNIFTRMFFVIYIIISISSSTAASLLGEFSLSNGIIQLILTIGTFIYVYKTKPLKNILNDYQILVLEGLNIVKFCYIIWLNTKKIIDKEDLVIDILDYASIVVLVVFLGLKLIREIKVVRKFLHNHPERSRISWLNIVHVVVQQFGMGFEHSRVPKFYSQYSKDDKKDSKASVPTPGYYRLFSDSDSIV